MGAVGRGDHVPAGLVARLLESCDSCRSGHAGAGAAGVDIPVGGRVLHLLDFHLGHGHIDVGEGLRDDLFQPPVVQLALHMDNGLAPVQKLLLIDAGVVAGKEALFGRHHGVFQDVCG